VLRKLQNVSWQAVSLLLGGAALATATMVFAPPEVCAQLLGAQGFVTTVIGLFLQWEREKSPTDKSCPPDSVTTPTETKKEDE
jgi:hypothetical protein